MFLDEIVEKKRSIIEVPHINDVSFRSERPSLLIDLCDKSHNPKGCRSSINQSEIEMSVVEKNNYKATLHEVIISTPNINKISRSESESKSNTNFGKVYTFILFK